MNSPSRPRSQRIVWIAAGVIGVGLGLYYLDGLSSGGWRCPP